MSYTLTLTTESYLLTSSGEGGVLIDTDVVFHSTGFPIIPARRIKGMLKESLEEVLEISGKQEQELKEIVISLFGESGRSTYEGKLLFHSLMLHNWEQKVAVEIAANPEYGAFKPDFIKTYFTAEIQQTAIGRVDRKDEVEGVAKRRSLRNYRVIKPGISFEGLLETTAALTLEQEKFLERAILNLRNAGTRRNRGFGKVKCELKAAPQVSLNDGKMIDALSSKLAVTITTQSPIVLAEQLGEQNTVFTRKYITGNQLRGLLANAFIRKRNLSATNAHLDTDFLEIFLSGEVRFSNLTFKKAFPIPLHLHYYKLDKNRKPISIFAKEENDNEITKSIGGVGDFDGQLIKTDGFNPSTTFNFHNSRYNRAAGRSTEHDAETGIFYYESLNEGQSFYGKIEGKPALIAKLTKTLSDEFKAKLGRSRSAQYGSVLVKFSNDNGLDTDQTLSQDLYLMTLQSPLILLNEHGYPSPTVAVLQETLSAALSSEVIVVKAAAAFTYVEQFNAVWQGKSGKIPAFKEGSSFLVTLPQERNAPYQLGEWIEQGFGRIKFVHNQQGGIYELEKPPMKSVKKLTESQTKTTVSTPILKELVEAFEKEKEQLEIKSKAIEHAQKAKRINNHLIGRLERLVERSSSEREISDWVKETKGKPAGDALRKADLVDFDHIFDISAGQEIKSNWLLQKLYWITFFQTLRKINKKNGK